MVAQKVVEDVGHVVLLVVDDEWDAVHKVASIRAREMCIILSDFATYFFLLSINVPHNEFSQNHLDTGTPTQGRSIGSAR